MGGIVSIEAPKHEEKTFFMQRVVNDRDELSSLFKDIQTFGKSEDVRNSNPGLISLAEVLLFVEKASVHEFSYHYKGMVEVIKESFYYVVGSKKGTRLELPMKKFHKLLYAIFLFSHLWQIFAAADDHIDDGSIFVGEFVRAKDKICAVNGVTFLTDISDEEWRKEFYKIDRGGSGGGNGWISFREFIQYCCRAIVSPEEYCRNGGVRKQEKEVHVPHVPSEPKQIEFEGALKHEIKSTVPSAVVKKRKPSIANCNKNFDTKPDAKSSTPQCGSKKKIKAPTFIKNVFKKKKRITKKKKGAKISPKDSEKAVTATSNTIGTSKACPISVVEKSESIAPESTTPKVPEVQIRKNITELNIEATNARIREGNDNENETTKDYFAETRRKLDVLAIEREEEEEKEKLLKEYVRPMYRPRSAADVHGVVQSFQAWVQSEKNMNLKSKSWVDPDISFDDDEEAVAGFGIAGVDVVSFEYDMEGVLAENMANKKYKYRTKQRGKLWEPKYTKKKYVESKMS